MRYILDGEGYIYDISFGSEIECDLGTCTEYLGEVPSNYETIEEWANNEIDKLNAWKIVDGNLIFDENKYKELQEKWKIEDEENSCATKKYVNDKFKNMNVIYDDELSSQIEGSSLILIENTKEAADIPEIYITPNNMNTKINNSINFKITNENMLKNNAVTSVISGVSFKIDEDRSIILNGTATEDIEFILNGSLNSTKTLFFLKANQNYFKCGLSKKVLLNLYGNDGTDLELISSGSNGDLLFTNTKYITCTTLKVASGTKFNDETIFPMIQVGEYSSSINYEYIECKENDVLTIDLQGYIFENDDSISINRDEFTFNKHLFLAPSDDLLPDDELVPYDYFKDVLSGYVTTQISRENNTLIQCDKDVSMSVKYFSKDYLNNKFAEIEVAEEEIKLSVENKVNNEDYTKASIVAKINDDTSSIKIEADNVDIEANDVLNILAGNSINLLTYGLTIDSTNFKVTSEGNMTCNEGLFKGTINTNKDMIVGDNVYVGQNQSSSSDNIKYIYLSENGYIKRHKINDKDYISIYSNLNTRLSCNDTGYINVMEDTIQSSHNISVTSDKRLKKDIKDIDVSWINELKIKEFEYKNTPNKKQIGVIAQDYIGKDFSKYFLNQGIDQYYSVTYGNITNALIKYCQELNSKVENLTDMYNKQQEQIDKLNKEIEILRREK